MRRQWQILLAVGIVAGLLLSAVPGCAPAAPEEGAPSGGGEATYAWRFATIMPEGADCNLSSLRFAEDVLEASDGRIVVDCYPGGVLGDWQTIFEENMRGTIEFSLNCLSTVYDPRIGVTYTPYLVTTWEETKIMYAPGGFVYDKLDELLGGIGIKLLSSWPSDFMGVGTGERPPSPKDPDVPKNMKIRVWADPAPEAIMERFGYLPTVLPWSDVYSAFQMGVIDGVCTNLVSMWSYQRDLTNYWIYDHSLFEGWYYLMSLDLWNSLSSEDQMIVENAALEEQRLRIEAAEAAELANLQKFRDQGTEVILFTPEELAELREMAIEDIWPKLYAKIGKKIMDEAAAAVEALK